MNVKNSGPSVRKMMDARDKEGGFSDFAACLVVVLVLAVLGLYLYTVGRIRNTIENSPAASTVPSPAVTPSPVQPTYTPPSSSAVADLKNAIAPAPPTDVPAGPILGAALVIFGIAFIGFFGILSLVWLFRKMSRIADLPRTNAESWQTLISRHRELRAAWASYELDAIKLLDFPLMADMREPATVALHKALKNALNLEPKSVKSVRFVAAATSPFAAAVNELDVAFHVAESEARRVAWSKFSPDERKRLTTAKTLLVLAMDSGASPSERQAAYKRVFKEIEGLINIPQQTLLALEKTHMLSLTA